MIVKGHGGDAECVCQSPHRDGVATLAIDEAEPGLNDFLARQATWLAYTAGWTASLLAEGHRHLSP